MKDKSVSRRNFLHMGVGVAAAATGANAVAAVCGLSAAQMAGPFPPPTAVARLRDSRTGQVVNNPGGHVVMTDRDADMTVVDSNAAKADGQIIRLSGTVQDQNCDPVPFAVVDIWQADNQGHYNHQHDQTSSPDAIDRNFQYYALVKTDAAGKFSITTILPRFYGIGNGMVRTAHIHFMVRKTGYENLITQSYFASPVGVLNDIERIRELNRTDVILGRRRDLDDLIVNFTQGAEMPEGDLTLVVNKF